MDIASSPGITIEANVLSVYPGLVVQGFRAKRLDSSTLADVAVPSAEDLRARLQDRNLSLENLVQFPLIDGWRSAYKAAGLKPSTFKSSPEALARRILKGAPIATPLVLVNLYCAVSVATLAPLGAYDVASLPTSEITLRFARPSSDSFSPLGGDSSHFPLKESVPVYASNDEVICWAFNCQDSAKTCVSEDTRDLLLLGEAVTSEQRPALTFALKSLQQALMQSDVATSPIAEADATKTSCTFTHPAE